jgi:hypothetical protein
MTPADLRRLHKYMLEIEKIPAISRWSKASGRNLLTSCRRKSRGEFFTHIVRYERGPSACIRQGSPRLNGEELFVTIAQRLKLQQ